MQALHDAAIIAHIEFVGFYYCSDDESLEYDTDPEDFEQQREFPAQNTPCPLVGRLKSMAVKYMPPPPPRWALRLLAIWIAWCGVARSAAPWATDQNREESAIDAFKILTG